MVTMRCKQPLRVPLGSQGLEVIISFYKKMMSALAWHESKYLVILLLFFFFFGLKLSGKNRKLFEVLSIFKPQSCMLL